MRTPDFVLDASVTMSWCFDDEKTGYADQVLGALVDRAAAVPSVWSLEVTNVLLMAEKRSRISPADSTRFLRLLRTLPVMFFPDPPARMTAEVLALGRAHALTAYDASYLDLAMREGCPLATLDAQLRAALPGAAVSLFEP